MPCRQDGNRRIEQGRDRRSPEERLVALVVRMGDDRDAGAEEFRPRGRDRQVATALDTETDVVKGASSRSILDLCLGDRRPEVGVPHGGSEGLIDPTLSMQVEKRELRHPSTVFIDRRVGQRPVDRQSEPTPGVLEGLLVLDRQSGTRFDEVEPGDLFDGFVLTPFDLSRSPVRIVGQARLGTDAVDVLHPPFRGKPVVVPTHRIGDVLAGHPLIADQQVLVGVGETVADMKRSRHRRGWSVHHEGLITRCLRVPAIDAPLVPAITPPLLEFERFVALWYLQLHHYHLSGRRIVRPGPASCDRIRPAFGDP